MDEPCIRVRNLTKTFGGRTAVDNLSFAVEKGQVFALLGHNGAGKSTTIDLILSLKAPDGGTAKILGMDAAKHRKQVFERVGVQLQNTQYQPNITAEEACIEYASLYADPADYLAAWLLTMISMFSIGLMVASLCRTTKSMNVATSLLYFPMLLFSGATIPAEVFPAWFQAVAKLMPLGVGIDLLKSVSMGCYDRITLPAITLMAITLICGTIAVKTFRWE